MKRAFAAVSLGLTFVAQAQLVVGNDQSGVATIYHVDVESGVATPLYASSTTDAKPWGMAYDPSTNMLYWNNGSTLFSSPFSMAGLTPTNLGTMTFNAATVNFVALAFRNGQLLGTRNIATEAVYAIDIESRVATQLWIHPTTFDFGGLDVDLTTGDLFGLSDTAPAGGVRGLYLVDDAAQTTTFVAPYPAGETDIDGLAVHNGRAYYVTDGPNTTQANFYVFDTESGTQLGTLPSPFTGSGTFCAAAYITPGGPSCDPDVNCDGVPDQDDVACIILAVAGDMSCFCQADPDFNGDGVPDQGDVADVILTVAGAPCP